MRLIEQKFAYPRVDRASRSPSTTVFYRGGPLRWSSDGRYIAFLGGAGPGSSTTIWIIDVNTQQFRSLFSPPPPVRKRDGIVLSYKIEDFVWSPDSQQIVFAGSSEAECRRRSWFPLDVGNTCRTFLYGVDLHTTQVMRLTQTPQERFARLAWLNIPSQELRK